MLDVRNWRIVRDEDVPAYIRHPLHGGRVAQLVRLGHDGATLARYPHVECGHMNTAAGHDPAAA